MIVMAKTWVSPRRLMEPRGAQGGPGPGRPREARGGQERPRKAQEGPGGKPRETQGGPGRRS